MKRYFLHNGHAQMGPFDIDDLKTKDITKQTSIWYEGLQDWITADNVPELQSLFVNAPPPFQQQKIFIEEEHNPISNASYYLNNQKKKSPYRIFGIVITLLVLMLAGKLIYDQIDQQNAIASRQNMINVEEDAKRLVKNNITSYVKAELSDYLYSTLGGIKNLSVVVNNNTDYIIDQVQVKLFYYKPNGTVWDTRIITFNLLDPQTKNTIRVPDTNRGVRVEKEIISIKSRVLGLQ
jgi:hypothetical protein